MYQMKIEKIFTYGYKNLHYWVLIIIRHVKLKL